MMVCLIGCDMLYETWIMLVIVTCKLDAYEVMRRIELTFVDK